MRKLLLLCLVPLLCAAAQSLAANHLQTPGARAVRPWYSASGGYNRSPWSGTRANRCPPRSSFYGTGSGYTAPNCRHSDSAWGAACGVRFSGWTVHNTAGQPQGRTYGYSGRYGSDTRIRFFSGRNLSATHVSANGKP